jgi:DNA polymerase-1
MSLGSPTQLGLPLSDPLFATQADLVRCSGRVVSIDTETTGLHWWRDRVSGVGFYVDEDLKGYIPIGGKEDLRKVREILLGWDPSTTVVGHNLKFDFHFLGIGPEAPWADRIIDSTVLVHLYDGRLSKRLSDAAKMLLGDTSKSEILSKLGPRKNVGQLPPFMVAEYCVNDCRLALELARKLMPIIRERGQSWLFKRSMEYFWLLLEVERYGIYVDADILQRQRRSIERVLRYAEKEIYHLAGRKFDWRSPHQLAKVLYEELKLERPRNPFAIISEDGTEIDLGHTRNKVYNTTRTSSHILLQHIKPVHPIAEPLLAARQCDKLIAEIDLFLELMDEKGYLHPGFNQTGTKTGRLSSREPNSQNIPGLLVVQDVLQFYPGPFRAVLGSDEEIRENLDLRFAFVPPPGKKMFAIDYSQMEIRVFAILAGDDRMLEILRTGRDIHREAAILAWGTAEGGNRERAKFISFGLIYGMSAASLSFRLGISREEADRINNQYLDVFPKIRPFMTQVIQGVRKNGYVTYWSGRRSYEENPQLIYKMVNHLVQGSCADILMLASLRVREHLKSKGYWPEFRIWNLVHDELDFYCPPDTPQGEKEQIAKIMEVPDALGFPLKVSIKEGERYGDFEL